MVFQKDDEQGERTECLVEAKVEWLDSVGLTAAQRICIISRLLLC